MLPILPLISGLVGIGASAAGAAGGVGNQNSNYKPYTADPNSAYMPGMGPAAGSFDWFAAQEAERVKKEAALTAKLKAQELASAKYLKENVQPRMVMKGGVYRNDYSFLDKLATEAVKSKKIRDELEALNSPEQQQKSWVQGIQQSADAEKRKYEQLAQAGLISGQQAIEGMRAADAVVEWPR